MHSLRIDQNPQMMSVIIKWSFTHTRSLTNHFGFTEKQKVFQRNQNSPSHQRRSMAYTYLRPYMNFILVINKLSKLRQGSF